MIGQLGCKMFQSPKLKTSTLREKLAKYSHTTKNADLPRPLVENVTEFTVSHGVVRFTYLYDFVMLVPYREETQTMVRTAAAEVAIIDPPAQNLYFVYANAQVADSVAARLGRAVAGQDDYLESVEIPAARLRKLITDEAVEVKYGWWDGIDTHARKGALKGNVLRSKFYTQFKSADPTTLTYESKSTGRTVRVTNRGTLTIYGKGVTKPDLEQYATDVILAD
jgi:hypothetical protein